MVSWLGSAAQKAIHHRLPHSSDDTLMECFMLTQKLVQSIFDYSDGLLIRKLGREIDKGVAGFYTPKGYTKVKIGKRAYTAHRIIYLWHHGILPEFIDHIDGNRSNNKIENLREATKAENCANQKIRNTNTSGMKGVSWHKANKKWKVAICKNYKSIYLGTYEDYELACLVAVEGTNLHHKEFSAFKGTQNGI